MANFPIKTPRRKILFDGIGRDLALVVPVWESSGNELVNIHTAIHPGGISASQSFGTAPDFSPGVHGPCVNFPTGVDSRYEIAASLMGDFVGRTADQPFTLLALIKPDLATGDIANLFTSTQAGTDALYLFVRETGSIAVNGDTTSAARAETNTGIVPIDGSTWSVIAATWSPDIAIPKIYLNGLEVAAATSTSGTTWGTIDIPYYLGGRNDTALNRQFIGAMSLFAGWSRALSDAEIHSVSANPWMIFEQPETAAHLEAGIGSIHIGAGTATLVLTVTAPAVADHSAAGAESLALTVAAPATAEHVATASESLAITVTAPAVADHSAAGAESLVITTATDGQPVDYQIPTSDITAGTWENEVAGVTNLYLSIDEGEPGVTSDYIISTSLPDTVEVRLSSSGDPASSVYHVVQYSAERTDALSLDLTLSLVQNTTVLDTWTDTIPQAETLFQRVLSGAVTDSITDYTNLRLRMTASVT